jgi:hypothetical protein
VRIGSAAFLDGRTLQAVEVTPPVGPKKQLWFDKKTGLVARITHYRDQYDWNEEVGGWKLLAGRKRPTLFTTGMSQFRRPIPAPTWTACGREGRASAMRSLLPPPRPGPLRGRTPRTGSSCRSATSAGTCG